MNIAALFIRRPIMTGLVMATLLLFGIMAYRALPVSDLPNVDYPMITVSASLPGANPDTMASAVALPLEKEFSTIAGVDSISSTSTMGGTMITLQFILSRNIDAAAQDVQAAIARAGRRLPKEINTSGTPPTYQKVNPADYPVIYLALVSKFKPMSELDARGALMAQQISVLDGVAQVMVYGGQKRAVRIQVDPNELASRGIGLDDVNGVISSQNVNTPTGVFYGADQAKTIQANGQLTRAEQYEDLVVASSANGQPVRLGELGRVLDSVENDKVAAWFCTGAGADRPLSAERSIVLAVLRQPGTNTVAVTEAIKRLLPAFREQLPASISLEILLDRSIFIKESANDVTFTLELTLVLVVLVIFLFLRNISATVIPSMVLPMSIVGTFLVMYLLDYSLDNLSLMALTLSVGFVVDDAIVMLENIVRHMEMGKPRMQAALDGSREISFTIISMTLSLAAVFIPVLFLPGLVGRLFREFSVTIGAAVLVSGFVSLTLTPMLASRFLRDPALSRKRVLFRMLEAVNVAGERSYGWMLRGVLRHRRLTMLFSLAILAGTVYLFTKIPKSFIPTEDRDQLIVQTEAAQDISFNSMLLHQQEIARIVQADPAVDRFMSNIGGGFGGRSLNNGRVMIMLKPRAQRDVSAEQIMERLRPKLAAVPGIRAMIQVPQTIQIGGRQTKSLYQITLQGADAEQLYSTAYDLEKKMAALPGLADVASDMLLKSPQLDITIDRDQASLMGISASSVEDMLYSAFSVRQVSTIYAPEDQYQVILELLPEYQRDPSVLSMLYVHSTSGGVSGPLVPIKGIAEVKDDIGPLAINHTGQLPSVTLSFNIQPGVPLSDATREVKDLLETAVPAGITASSQGTTQAFESALSNLYMLLALAVMVIYVVLGILYENLYHPITILSALPFAGVGALATLILFHCELSMYAFVGIIMLVGLVKKNGIMMVDFAVAAQREHGKDPQTAIYEACLTRFRPIMMTTMAALMAGLPIAMGYGAGAEARRPLGLAVVGGLLFSQTLTLFVTPVFFVYMEKLQAFLHRLRDVRPATEGPADQALLPAAALGARVPPPLPSRRLAEAPGAE